MKIIDIITVSHPTLHVDDSLDKIAKGLFDDSIHCVPVIDNEGNIFGVITSTVLANAIIDESNKTAACAWEVCIREFPVAHPDDSVSDSVELIHKSQQNFLIVAENDRYIGLITASSLLSITDIDEENKNEAMAVIDPKVSSNELR
ncbi:MAG: CBS domain-containing protein [Pseudohongiellaceae bacterium]